MGLENLHYLAIDPGEARTGWAAFDESGDDIEFSAIHGGADAFVGETLFEELSKTFCHTFTSRGRGATHVLDSCPANPGR